MLTDQTLPSLAHCLHVESAMSPTDAPSKQSGSHPPIEQHITIVARFRTEASVKIIVNLHRPQHDDVGPEVAIHTTHPRLEGAAYGGVEVRNLGGRVNAGVGTSRADKLNRLMSNLSECNLERVLHCTAMPLGLPPFEGITVVFDADCNPHRLAPHTTAVASPAIASQSGQRSAARSTKIGAICPSTRPSSNNARHPPSNGDST